LASQNRQVRFFLGTWFSLSRRGFLVLSTGTVSFVRHGQAFFSDAGSVNNGSLTGTGGAPGCTADAAAAAEARAAIAFLSTAIVR
jgi:hypothetical protein